MVNLELSGEGEAGLTDGESGPRVALFLPDGSKLWFQPGDAWLLGRADDCDLQIGHDRVSRRHARLEWRADWPGPRVTDLGSANGTAVGGVAVPPQEPVSLPDVTTLALGGIVLGVGAPAGERGARSQVGPPPTPGSTQRATQRTTRRQLGPAPSDGARREPRSSEVGYLRFGTRSKSSSTEDAATHHD